MKARRTLSLLLALLLIPSGTLAQDSAGLANDWTKVQAVQPGEKVVVELKSGKREKGTLSAVSESGLTLSNGNEKTEARRDDIRTVRRVTGASVKKATLIGTATGATGGAIAGAAAGGCDPARESICIFGRGASAAALGVIGAGIGAMTGFVIGKFKHKETLIYETR